MRKFEVVAQMTKRYHTTVEASSRQEAIDKAEMLSDDVWHEDYDCLDWDIIDAYKQDDEDE